ncbi:MAG TPA: type II secretion system F family protein [Nocardioides sp.]|nr:type II secretion system F family protein [Nocardioides sp.]
MSEWLTALLLAATVAALVPSVRPVAGSGSTPGARRPRGSPPRRSLSVPVVAARRRAAADQAAVLEVCDLLAADLAAGRPPDAALAAGAGRWPPLLAVVEASRLGADVPEAMRRLAGERRGAADLRWVAGAWQVAQHSGHGLAAALERTAAGLRARRRTRRLVDSELASARSTARLVACLPVAVLLMGSGAGSDPWSFLVSTPVGWACGGIGLALVGLGLWWIERLADSAVAL